MNRCLELVMSWMKPSQLKFDLDKSKVLLVYKVENKKDEVNLFWLNYIPSKEWFYCFSSRNFLL